MPADAQLDHVAHRLRAEIIEIAVDQISKPIAHEFDIRIDLMNVEHGTSVIVEASSRSVESATVQVRVDVRSTGDHVVVEREGGRSIVVDVAEADPAISPDLHHRLSDFVAGCIAAALARLNAEMQRRLGRP